MYNKKNGRVTFKSNRRSGFKRSSNYSNPKFRNKGNVTQQYNKYLKLGKEAFTSGDRIQSEYYYQFTDHYYRLMVEMGINFEDSESISNSKSDTEKLNEKVINSKNESVDSNIKEEVQPDDQNDQENEDESIESIPFIAEPAKKKRVRSTK
ncbi:MAG: hypothetical protein CMI96_01885 [Pelagibacteraceae bacterium]|nr:hypothetical protein [Pelagibacteraceae bacterium]|tara:strand:- start:1795 stop:2247 length:453 start_codon:yes stop_codon:yes gene_type:complete